MVYLKGLKIGERNYPTCGIESAPFILVYILHRSAITCSRTLLVASETFFNVLQYTIIIARL